MSLPQVLIKDKYCLTIDEAVAYFNIIQNGVKTLIKRKKFEAFLDRLSSI